MDMTGNVTAAATHLQKRGHVGEPAGRRRSVCPADHGAAPPQVAYTGPGCDYQKIHDFFVALGYDLHAVYDPPPYTTPSSVEPWFIPGQAGAPDGGNDAIYTLRNPQRGSPCKQHRPSMCDC